MNRSADRRRRQGLVQGILQAFSLPGLGRAVLVLGLALPATTVSAQEVLTLHRVLDAINGTHPLMQGARTEVEAGELDVDAANRRRWPTVSAVMESDTGSLTTQPSRALQIQQTLWDGGRVSALIAQAEAGMAKSESRVAAQREQLYLRAVAAWQTMLGARDRIKVAEDTLAQLRIYEAQMQRRVDANASPQIDLELVMSRIRQTEVEAAAALANLKTAAMRLTQLSGITGLDAGTQYLPALPSGSWAAPEGALYERADLFTYAQESASVRVAKGDAEIARAQLDGKLAERWPTAYARVSRPIGRLPVGADDSARFFVGLSYTPGAGFATAVEADALAKRVNAIDDAVEAARRESLEAMAADREEFFDARRRMAPLAEAVNGSRQVLESYSRQFTAGRKSWIDLLNAVRELAQNRFALVDAQASMTGSLYRLQIRTGRDSVIP